ncbi:hypothetical protein CRG98_017550 [Punica granatum]|uniref:Uncharacterized protein n=1 Tax=Punica granatum TaxID=22663 RepID=A0A2I0K0S7_PUNGR|nr:hypothetical protein CRG98_017550 [Punica granatum]
MCRAAVARNQGSSQETPPKRLSILSRPFGLGWRDRNKGKPDEPGSGHSSPLPKETSGQEPEH